MYGEKIFAKKIFFFQTFFFQFFFLLLLIHSGKNVPDYVKIFTSLIRLVKPLGNDIPCIALVMVRTFPGGGSIVLQRLGWNNF